MRDSKDYNAIGDLRRAAQAAGLEVKALGALCLSSSDTWGGFGPRGPDCGAPLEDRGGVCPLPRDRREVWLVDEASLISARDMARLLEAAEAAKARTILVGDVKQLGSVGAGAAFVQLQQAGMQTARLTEIVRQTNAQTLAAVEATLTGN